MTGLLMIQLTTGVWVARGERDQWLRADAHPYDRAAATALPRRRAEEFLASRALLRHLLRATLPHQADSPIHAGAHGRPVLAGHPHTGISISHDGDTVAVAVAVGRQVGVDVQQPPDHTPDPLLRRILGTHAPQVRALPEPHRSTELAWVWTAQEACVKAAGTGLSGRPWTIDIPPCRHRGRWNDYRWISLRDHSRTPLSCSYTALPHPAQHLPQPRTRSHPSDRHQPGHPPVPPDAGPREDPCT
ncbi:4'-phosphopantetheinyl transferase family protein [Streptomyces ossamyceticus]|jgi:4'-phosphopantetheinyl transferase|uniref:4'-phosphopantetheinyl transferase superfamily protein n=1 Tax=Streptomyces ossamyceticus TaxID=249581 RepID=A0ABV2UWR0_9ACTN